MSDQGDKRTTYAMTEESAISQISQANRLFNRGKHLLEAYFCGDIKLRYKEKAIELLTEHMTNSKFYARTIENYLFAGERVKSEKDGEDNIIIPAEDFTIINTYLVVVASCENELECLGISMREH